MTRYNTIFALTLVLALGLMFGCGGGANANKTNAPANTNANKPASTPAPASNSNAEKSSTGSNEELDFTLVNKTGYAIKEVYVGPTANKEWNDDNEVMKGRAFADGDKLDIKFHPKATAAKWDIRVDWADGSGSVEWNDLDLTKIDKITLKYDKATDKTTAVTE